MRTTCGRVAPDEECRPDHDDYCDPKVPLGRPTNDNGRQQPKTRNEWRTPFHNSCRTHCPFDFRSLSWLWTNWTHGHGSKPVSRTGHDFALGQFVLRPQSPFLIAFYLKGSDACPGAHRQVFGQPLGRHGRLPAQPQRDRYLPLIPEAICEPCGQLERERGNRSTVKTRGSPLHSDGVIGTSNATGAVISS